MGIDNLLNPTARKVMEGAYKEAFQDSRSKVDVKDLMAGLIKEGDKEVKDYLEGHGLKYSKAFDKANIEITSSDKENMEFDPELEKVLARAVTICEEDKVSPKYLLIALLEESNIAAYVLGHKGMSPKEARDKLLNEDSSKKSNSQTRELDELDSGWTKIEKAYISYFDEELEFLKRGDKIKIRDSEGNTKILYQDNMVLAKLAGIVLLERLNQTSLDDFKAVDGIGARLAARLVKAQPFENRHPNLKKEFQQVKGIGAVKMNTVIKHFYPKLYQGAKTKKDC